MRFDFILFYLFPIENIKYVIKFIRSFRLKQKFYSPKEVKRVGTTVDLLTKDVWKGN